MFFYLTAIRYIAEVYKGKKSPSAEFACWVLIFEMKECFKDLNSHFFFFYGYLLTQMSKTVLIISPTDRFYLPQFSIFCIGSKILLLYAVSKLLRILCILPFFVLLVKLMIKSRQFFLHYAYRICPFPAIPAATPFLEQITLFGLYI